MKTQEAELIERIRAGAKEPFGDALVKLLVIELDRVKDLLIDATKDQIDELQGRARFARKLLKYLT